MQNTVAYWRECRAIRSKALRRMAAAALAFLLRLEEWGVGACISASLTTVFAPTSVLRPKRCAANARTYSGVSRSTQCCHLRGGISLTTEP